MANWTHFHLVRIEFLGFRYHGWQKQPNHKSVHGMIDKTMSFILQHENYKTLGCGRTDAKVSANDYAFELFTNEAVVPEQLLHRLNLNLPSDIRAKSVVPVDRDFNIIQHARIKEYHYYFSYGEKSHPFNAPLIRDFGRKLDIDKMKRAARLFVGIHNFKRYASKPGANTDFEREIISSEIVANDQINGSFIAENSFIFKISSRGFMRYQVRLMMGALVEVGRGTWSVHDLERSLVEFEGDQIMHIAPSSGLMLHRVVFE